MSALIIAQERQPRPVVVTKARGRAAAARQVLLILLTRAVVSSTEWEGGDIGGTCKKAHARRLLMLACSEHVKEQ